MENDKPMFIPKILATLFMFFCLAAPFVQAAENFDIDLKELRPAPVTKPVPKQQNLEIDIKELKATKAKKKTNLKLSNVKLNPRWRLKRLPNRRFRRLNL